MKSKSLILFCLFTFVLSLLRIVYTDTFSFIFLNWNLFLAFVPLIFASAIEKFNSTGWKFWLLFFCWLIFFPNAPYIITDLKYINRSGMNFRPPSWFDIVLISSFAINGLLLGFISTQKIFIKLQSFYGKIVANVIIIGCMLLSGFGVYLGRFGRFNSWDVISQPQDLLTDIGQTFIHPFRNAHSIELSLLFGILSSFVFFSFKEIADAKN